MAMASIRPAPAGPVFPLCRMPPSTSSQGDWAPQSSRFSALHGATASLTWFQRWRKASKVQGTESCSGAACFASAGTGTDAQLCAHRLASNCDRAWGGSLVQWTPKLAPSRASPRTAGLRRQRPNKTVTSSTAARSAPKSPMILARPDSLPGSLPGTSTSPVAPAILAVTRATCRSRSAQ